MNKINRFFRNIDFAELTLKMLFLWAIALIAKNIIKLFIEW